MRAVRGEAPWYALYNVVLHLGSLVCLPFWLFVRLVRGRYKGQFLERMGFLPARVLAPFGERSAVWIHAASAGESASAAPLVRRLRAIWPDRPFLFTVTSRYGKEMAIKRLRGEVDAVCFSPLDLPLFCARFLDRIRPFLYVMVETDLWPNLVRRARRRGVKIVVASGHAGPRGFPRPFWRAVLFQVDLFLMQTENDARNLIRRGALPERVQTSGNLKFEGSGRRLSEAQRTAWRSELQIPDEVPVLVAGSSLAEDEGPILDAVASLRAEGFDLHAIIAPRRQERVAELSRRCAQLGLACALRTKGGEAPILILDTMGELAKSYNLATAAYVGGGLTRAVGLHNLLEPMVCGVPVVFGSHHGKARRIAEELLRAGAGREIEDGAGLLRVLRELLGDPGRRAALVEAGESVLVRHRGAARRQAERIRELVQG